MKILALVHGYPPLHNAGAEWMLHEMLLDLKNKGHSVEVFTPETIAYSFEGIEVRNDIWTDTKKAVLSCDLIIGHLHGAGRALNICEYFKKPFIQIIHNTNDYGILRVKHKEAKKEQWVYAIYNSLYTKSEMKYPNPAIVVHPPVDQSRYKIARKGKKLTLINLFDRKGGLFFIELAKLMPDREFLGIEGDYGRQEKCLLPNVTYMANTPDIKKIYSQTRILLMPSQYESYGRTGIEAMCSGIPVIAAPTPGLKESLGNAGIFCQLDSLMKWTDAIKRLDDPEEYKEASKKCFTRVKEIEKGIKKELNNLEIFFSEILEKRTA